MMEKTMIVSRSEIEGLLSEEEYMSIMENVHSRHALNMVYEPDFLHADLQEGEFHMKTGGIRYNDKQFYGVKLNGGFMHNPERYGLPSILGIIYICDARSGFPLAVMDSVAISRNRTAAASAVAVRYLAANEDADMGIFGYGVQAEYQLRYISKVRNINIVRVSGRNPDKAREFVKRLQGQYPFPVQYDTIENTARKSNLIVTATSSREAYIRKEWVRPGTFIAAVGADSPGKQELDPELPASSIVVADIRRQACSVGESQHAIAQGLMSSQDIYAEIGEIITGKKRIPGDTKTIIYDSTGTALQDVGAGVFIYEKIKDREGMNVDILS